MTDTRQCTECEQTKPLTAFGSTPGRKTCSACRQRAARATIPREDQNAQMRAYKAGMRKDKCATCAGPITGLGVCSRCQEAMDTLGGTPEALKAAAKALKWLQDG